MISCLEMIAIKGNNKNVFFTLKMYRCFSLEKFTDFSLSITCSGVSSQKKSKLLMFFVTF